MPYFSDDKKYFIKNTNENEIENIKCLQTEPVHLFVPKLIKVENNMVFLENILYNYENPCICDIKLGRRTCGILSD